MDVRTFAAQNRLSRQVTEGAFDRCEARHWAAQRPGVAVFFDRPDGGVSAIMRAPRDAGCLHAMYSTLGPNLEKVKLDQDQEVVYLILDPISEMGAVVERQAGRANSDQIGLLRTQARQVGSARKGAVTHAGGRADIVCYAEI
jgi:hypothetical protein